MSQLPAIPQSRQLLCLALGTLGKKLSAHAQRTGEWSDQAAAADWWCAGQQASPELEAPVILSLVDAGLPPSQDSNLQPVKEPGYFKLP